MQVIEEALNVHKGFMKTIYLVKYLAENVTGRVADPKAWSFSCERAVALWVSGFYTTANLIISFAFPRR